MTQGQPALIKIETQCTCYLPNGIGYYGRIVGKACNENGEESAVIDVSEGMYFGLEDAKEAVFLFECGKTGEESCWKIIPNPDGKYISLETGDAVIIEGGKIIKPWPMPPDRIHPIPDPTN